MQHTSSRLGSLRDRWRSASAAAGWRYPGDWAVPEVDTVCAAALAGQDLAEALSALGRARARAGATLPETLADLAALHAVLTVPHELVSPNPDATPAALLRRTAESWAEAATAPAECGADPLTGLSTAAYLRVRVGEMYREARRAGTTAGDRFSAVVISLDLSATSGWSRLMASVLLAECLREVFDGGETVAALGSSVVLVIARRGDGVGHRAAAARHRVASALMADPALVGIGVRVRGQVLPGSEEEAREMLRELARG
ncbi:GGDEF domain-containing protein [Actinokineospora pegani]|uniref:GGDEF domain-containing protein n=1 Tax=Actinokineospora pegani TaxID=2654637 RepID=UPI001F3C1AB1|nr:GGDEF domain-containing protein [Actinokineospora pegani]